MRLMRIFAYAEKSVYTVMRSIYGSEFTMRIEEINALFRTEIICIGKHTCAYLHLYILNTLIRMKPQNPQPHGELKSVCLCVCVFFCVW